LRDFPCRHQFQMKEADKSYAVWKLVHLFTNIFQTFISLLWWNWNQIISSNWLYGYSMTQFQLHMLLALEDMRWKEDHEWWVGKNLQRGSCGLYEVISQHSSGKTGKSQETSVRIHGKMTNIQIGYLSKTSLEYYC
jgi:hypothetical protein